MDKKLTLTEGQELTVGAANRKIRDYYRNCEILSTGRNDEGFPDTIIHLVDPESSTVGFSVQKTNWRELTLNGYNIDNPLRESFRICDNFYMEIYYEGIMNLAIKMSTDFSWKYELAQYLENIGMYENKFHALSLLPILAPEKLEQEIDNYYRAKLTEVFLKKVNITADNGLATENGIKKFLTGLNQIPFLLNPPAEIKIDFRNMGEGLAQMLFISIYRAISRGQANKFIGGGKIILPKNNTPNQVGKVIQT